MSVPRQEGQQKTRTTKNRWPCWHLPLRLFSHTHRTKFLPCFAPLILSLRHQRKRETQTETHKHAPIGQTPCCKRTPQEQFDEHDDEDMASKLHPSINRALLQEYYGAAKATQIFSSPRAPLSWDMPELPRLRRNLIRSTSTNFVWRSTLNPSWMTATL